MPEDNTNPEGQSNTDDSQQPAQGQSTPENKGQEQTPQGEQANENTPKPDGTASEGSNTPGVKTVPIDRFTTVYRRMKDAERKAQELEEKSKTPEANNNQPTQKTAPQTDEPRWEDYDATGKSEAEWQSDWVDWKAEQKFKSLEAQREQAKQQDAVKTRQEKAEINLQTTAMAARAKYSDFDQKLQEARNLGIQYHPAIELAIAEQDNAGELGYHLAKNHELSYKLMQLPPESALLELGRFIAKHPTDTSPSAVREGPDLDTPLNPLNGGGAPHSGPVTSDTSQADFDRMFPPD